MLVLILQFCIARKLRRIRLSSGLRPLPPAPFCLWDCHLGGLVPRLLSLESSISAFRKTILTLREQPSIHLNISCFFFLPRMPFGKLGAFFFEISGSYFCTPGAPRGTILAPREHLGMPFWCLGSSLGGHFGTTLENHGSSRMDTKLQMT